MADRILTRSEIGGFHAYLIREEKSAATVEKYLRDAAAFLAFVGQSAVTKEAVMAYKKALLERGYAVRSINSMLASLNRFLDVAGFGTCRVRPLRIQRRIFQKQERELT